MAEREITAVELAEIKYLAERDHDYTQVALCNEITRLWKELAARPTYEELVNALAEVERIAKATARPEPIGYAAMSGSLLRPIAGANLERALAYRRQATAEWQLVALVPVKEEK